MGLAPVEIRHVRLRRTLLGGYRRAPVDRLLDDATKSFEEVWRERADLRDRVEHLEAELKRHRELEALLRETLLTAERSAHEVREQAHAEAEVVIREAHTEARSITQSALAERERLLGDVTRIQALLRAALTSSDEAAEAVRASGVRDAA